MRPFSAELVAIQGRFVGRQPFRLKSLSPSIENAIELVGTKGKIDDRAGEFFRIRIVLKRDQADALTLIEL
jgi:hypothetical protein